MNTITFNKDFFSFLQKCPTPFHTCKTMGKIFQEADFTALHENKEWVVKKNRGYYCIRDDGSLIGFKLANTHPMEKPWRMITAHSDSPTLQVKPLPVRTSKTTLQLCVEVYGGPLLSTWFDRDLGIGGRVSVLTEANSISTCIIDFNRSMAIIPSLAIHLDRNANQGQRIEKQKQLYPLFCQCFNKDFSLHEVLLQQIKKEYPGLSVCKIMGFELFCYDTNPPQLVGLNDDYIAAGRLDNLVSCFVGVKALLKEDTADNSLFLCSNHEEIGSASFAGAKGNFLSTVLERLMPNVALKSRLLHDSYLLSLDNAHAAHPNFPEKNDPEHFPLLNKGPVIKYNANQRYATTSKTAALYKILAEELSIPIQEFVMNNDIPCGSTIGPIAATKLGIQTVDVGIPSLGMHSIRETIGSQDPFMLYETIAYFYTRPTLP